MIFGNFIYVDWCQSKKNIKNKIKKKSKKVLTYRIQFDILIRVGWQKSTQITNKKLKKFKKVLT